MEIDFSKYPRKFSALEMMRAAFELQETRKAMGKPISIEKAVQIAIKILYEVKPK
jgi:hypothetical protein